MVKASEKPQNSNSQIGNANDFKLKNNYKSNFFLFFYSFDSHLVFNLSKYCRNDIRRE
jgi:hypothetical protein